MDVEVEVEGMAEEGVVEGMEVEVEDMEVEVEDMAVVVEVAGEVTEAVVVEVGEIVDTQEEEAVEVDGEKLD